MWKDNPIKKLLIWKKLRIRINTVIAGIVFTYMFFATGEALWQNFQINQEIVVLKDNIIQLEQRNIQYKNLIAYLKTESFREKEARRKLGYKKPGETVVAIPQDTFLHIDPGTTKTNETPENKPVMSNPQKWWDYIFG
ncbi:septum formation initiator family protein [Patescibacteria group bacterium]|nr:septum formation initiator family protein [Patescibacteria group bacterium]